MLWEGLELDVKAVEDTEERRQSSDVVVVIKDVGGAERAEGLEEVEEDLLVLVDDFVLGVGQDVADTVQAEPDDVEVVGLDVR